MKNLVAYFFTRGAFEKVTYFLLLIKNFPDVKTCAEIMYFCNWTILLIVVKM